jgi:hypothetical protein
VYLSVREQKGIAGGGGGGARNSLLVVQIQIQGDLVKITEAGGKGGGFKGHWGGGVGVGVEFEGLT